MKKWCRELILSTDGQDLVEYALLSGLISLACVVAVTTVGTSISVVFQAIADQLEQ